MTAVVVYMYKVKCHTAKYTATGAEEREPLELPLDLSGLHFDRRGETDSTLWMAELYSGIAPSCSDSDFNKPSKNQGSVEAILHNPADGLRKRNLKSTDKFFQLY